MKLTEAVLVAPKQLEFQEREIPPLTGRQVLVRVSACGVCSSEIPVYLGRTQGAPGASHRYWKYPNCLGHEVSGVIEDVGPDVECLYVGDDVTGICYSASGFATHVIEDARFWFHIPEGFKPEEVLGEPLACIENIYQRISEVNPCTILYVGDGFMSIVLSHRFYRQLNWIG